ncbi:MAG: FtsX-like permease family protein [Thermoprotei archaeon]
MSRIRRLRTASISLRLHRITVKFIILALTLLLLSGSLMVPSSAQTTSSQANISPYVTSAVSSVSQNQIMGYAQALSNFGTRVTGYKGNLEAAKYIESVLKADGLGVINQSFTAAVPIDEGSWASFGGNNYTVYALWPNGPVPGATPTYVSGPLVYVGNGTLSDMDGKQINGSIVLENFNSGSNWLYAADLGAKAIIFLAPTSTTQLQSLEKTISEPLYMPRLYAEGKAASALLAAANKGITVSVHDGMQWENVTSYNIIGVVNGTTDPSDIIALAANYDSWSPVPAIAPGGQDALGISTLLAAAKYFEQNRPYRTIWIVALSGFWEGEVGPFAFVQKNLYSPKNLAGITKIWMVEGLSLSSATPSMDALYFGWLNGLSLQMTTESKYLNYLQPEIQGFIQDAGLPLNLSDGLPTVDFPMYGAGFDWGTQPSFYMLPTEPVTQTGTLGFTLMTSFARRTTWNTPLNNLGSTNWDNVMAQVRTFLASAAGFADVPDLNIAWSSDAPQTMAKIMGAAVYVLGGLGFPSVQIRTVEFNYTTGWYSSMPDLLVQIPRPIWSGGSTSSGAANPLYWEFVNQWFFTNSKGDLTYYGAIPYWAFTAYAWGVNSSSGQLDYSVNSGVYGTAQGVSGGLLNSIPSISSQVSYMSIPVFQGQPVSTFDVFDPRTMIPAAIYDNRNPTLALFTESPSADVYKEATRASPTFYYVDLIPSSTVLTSFVQRGEKIVIVYNPNPAQTAPLIILDNASKADPEGAGFTINGPYQIHDSFYEQAKDMYLLVQERYSNMQKHYATSPAVVKLMSIANQYLGYAKGNLTEMNYAAAYNDSMVSWAYSSQAYATQLMPMYGQISTSMLFFTFLIIPFAYFFEELVLQLGGFKKILSIFVIIAGLVFIFSVINPSLSVISNSSMAVLGVGLLIFALFVVWVFYNDIAEMMREGAEKRLGYHTMASSTGAASMHAATTSVANMRRRPLMTALTLATIIIFAAGNVALTSTTSSIGISTSAVSGHNIPKEDAIFVKWLYGMPNTPSQILGPQIMNYLAGVGGTQFEYWPTYLYYPTLLYKYTFKGFTYSPQIVVPYQLAGTNSSSAAELVFMGLTSGNAHQLFNSYITSGNFSLGYDDAIITQYVANSIGAKVGDKVDFMGVGTFTVVGILQNNFTATNYNGYFATPEDPAYSLAANEGWSTKFSTEQFGEPISSTDIVLVNWRNVKDLGGFLSNVEIVPKQNVTYSQLKDLASIMRYPIIPTIYVGHDGSSVGLSSVATYSVLGFSLTLILLVIAALAILNAMYENVQIRRREIYTYASLGLSPNGATMMFVTESMVYALIGAVLGFLLGFSMDYVFISAHVLPSSFTFNFTSWAMLLSLLMIIIATLGGSYYPSRVSSKMITPSLSRKWKPTTKAKGKNWDMELPMKVNNEQEAVGVLRYLAEYYNGLGYEKPNFRLDGNVSIDEKALSVSFNVRLAPYESGIVQQVILSFIKTPASEYVLYATLKLTTGDSGLWSARAPLFIEDLRSQVILWRGLKPEQRSKYLGSSP